MNRGVVTDVGQVSTITLSSSIPAVGGQPAVRRHDLFGFGLFGLETDDAQIISIRPHSNAEADVVAVPYREVIYDGDAVEIPPFETNITPLSTRPPAPTVRDVISDERVITLDGTGSAKIRVAFDVDPLSENSLFIGSILEVQQRSNGIDEPWINSTIDERTQGRIIVAGVTEGEFLDFRLRWVPQGSVLPGPWTEVINHFVVGRLGDIPAPVITLTPIIVPDSSGLRGDAAILMEWEDTSPVGSDTLAYEVRLKFIEILVASNTVASAAERTEILGIKGNSTYEVRARYLVGGLVLWSDWVEVTTLDDLITAADINATLNAKIDAAIAVSDAALETLTNGPIFDLLQEVRIGDAILAAQQVSDAALQVVAFEETGDNSAAITTEQTARANADSAIASDITALQANVGDNAAALFTEQTARANADSALASDVTSLSADVSGNTSNISSLQAVKVDGAGAVAAVEQEINASYGSMTAMATATGFAEATADGIAAGYVWRLNGSNVLEAVSVADGVDSGPVSTFKIAADFVQITGLTQMNQAVINTLAADNGFITNLTVDRLNIAGNSATFADFAEFNGNTDGTGSLILIAAAGVLVPPGETTEILICVTLDHGYTGGPQDWGFRIRRTFGGPAVTLLERSGMQFGNDYPTVTLLEEITNNTSAPVNYIAAFLWNGQNSDIKLRRCNLSLFGRIR